MSVNSMRAAPSAVLQFLYSVSQKLELVKRYIN